MNNTIYYFDKIDRNDPRYEGCMVVDKEGKIWKMEKGELSELSATEAEMTQNGMNLYSFNQMLVGQMPILQDLTGATIKINNFNEDAKSAKYILLCRDINYYTLFERAMWKPDYDNLAEAVLDCAKDIGDIIDVDLTDAGTEIEIWVRTKEEKKNLCMYLCNATSLFVSFGG